MSETPIRPMEPAHIEGAHRLSTAARWPHRAGDWAFALGVSRGLVALDGERVVGTGLCTPYGDRARLSMIIVAEDQRGRGIGRRIVEGLVALAAGRRTTLVATPDGFPLYRKFGFEPAGQIAQCQGTVTTVSADGGAVRDARPADTDAILALDRAATDADRSALIRQLLAEGRAVVDEGGFAVLRPFGRGQVVGPIVARDAATAGSLLAAASRGLEGRFLRVDTDPALGLGPTLEAMGLAVVDLGTTMHAGPAPSPRGAAAFALASQALG